jgi:hypothetical protein
MAISEAQLETWSSQGSTGQFTDTYQSIRGKLLDDNAPYPVGDCEVFLQGSYGNDTNVHGDSDVDVVLKHKTTFYYDISALSAPEQAAFNAVFSGGATYAYSAFHADALAWIKKQYKDASPGKKAILVPGAGNRREADILIAQQFRRYHKFTSVNDGSYSEGICFFPPSGRIENFPKQHSQNCTAKHQSTNGWFKHTVRIFKNMRNSMIKNGYIAEGVAPSYFLEGMLSNVPDDKFGGTWENTWVNCFNWVVTAPHDKLVCANKLNWLVRDNSPTCWPVNNFLAFTAAAKRFWEA